MIPWGDLQDMRDLAVGDALGGEWPRLQLLAERYGAGDAVVARAGRVSDGERFRLEVTLVRHGPGSGPEPRAEPVTAGSADAFGEAVDAVVATLEDDWKRANLVSRDARTSVAVLVPIEDSFRRWIAIRRQIESIGIVREVFVRRLSRRAAVVEIVMVGDIDRLRTALRQQDLELRPDAKNRCLSSARGRFPNATSVRRRRQPCRRSGRVAKLTMTRRERGLFWMLLLAATVVFLIVLADVLLPVRCGMAIAYLLDPIVDRLEAGGVRQDHRRDRGACGFVLVVFRVPAAAGAGVNAQLLRLAELAPLVVARIERWCGPCSRASHAETRADRSRPCRRSPAGCCPGSPARWRGWSRAASP